MMHRAAHWLGTLLFATGIVLGLAGIGYWLLASQAEVTRSFPTPKALAAERVANSVETAVTTVSSTLRGVRSTPVPILTYHYIRGDVDRSADLLGYNLSVTPELFASQLDALQQAGFQTITPKEFLEGKVTDQSIILSFDDGYRDFYANAFPALNRRGMKAVAFVVSGFLDDKDSRYMTSDQVREVSRGGVEIGAHTVTHPDLTSLEPADVQAELLESRFALEKLIEERVTALAYPSGEQNERVVDIAGFVGYRFAVTTETGIARLADPHLTLPRLQVRADEQPADLIARINAAKTQAERTE